MILATCKKKGLRPAGWGRQMPVPAPWGSCCGDEVLSVLWASEGPLCLSFPVERSLESFRCLILVKSNKE